MKWTASGSRKVFCDFVQGGLGEWVTLLSSACSSLKVKTVDHNSFLGAGASGRVFKVISENGEFVALKISKNAPRLFSESTALNAAKDTGVVAKVVKSSVRINNNSGAAMIISPVGKTVMRSKLNADQVYKIVYNLFKLHSEGLQHGDPRLANIVLYKGKFIWIDFMDSIGNYDLWHSDASILACSILNLGDENDLPPHISKLINDYCEKKNKDSCKALASELWEHMPKS
jgi:predicted Ser/Thr protein kinase